MKFYTKRCSQNTQKITQQKQEGSLLDFRMFLSFTRSVLFLLPLASLFLLASCGDSSSSPTAGIDSGANLSIANSSANEGDASIYFRVTLRPAADSTVYFEYKTQRITANNDVAFTKQRNSVWGQSSHSSLVFDHNNNNNNNNMWILGGHGAKGAHEVFGRVWSSSNDEWRLATDDVGWDKRASHSSLVFNNKMWVLGGRVHENSFTDDASVKNDVWSSANGENWNEVKADSTNDPHSWPARQEHTSVVFDNKMWVLGGKFETGPRRDASFRNDVWSSTNGIAWNEVKADNNAGWSARQAHTSVVFDNKMWVLGGSGVDDSRKNDVWSSTNGITWTDAGASNHWSARQNHTSVVFEGKIWVLGGSADGGLKNDAWSSVDGKVWYKANKTDLWQSALQSHSSVVFKDKIWVLGGNDGGPTRVTNVVYSADTTGDYTSVSASASIPPGATTTDIKIEITNDSNGEEVETFELIISKPTNAVIDPARSKAIGTIQDND